MNLPGIKTSDLDAEDERIRAAYARRTAHDRYSCFNAAHLLAVQERERRHSALLQAARIRVAGDTRVSSSSAAAQVSGCAR